MKCLTYPQTDKCLLLLPKERAGGDQSFALLCCNLTTSISPLLPTLFPESWLYSCMTSDMLKSLSLSLSICKERIVITETQRVALKAKYYQNLE